jgi:hypothetical protein
MLKFEKYFGIDAKCLFPELFYAPNDTFCIEISKKEQARTSVHPA